MGRRIDAASGATRIALTLLVLSAVACGAPGGSPTSTIGTGGQSVSASPKATGTAVGKSVCSAIAGAEVGEIVGRDLAEATPDETGCTWSFFATGSREPSGSVVVRVEGDAGALDRGRAAYPRGSELDDVGERAWWAEDVDILYAVKGSATYAVQLVLFDAGEPREQIATMIAQLFLAKR